MTVELSSGVSAEADDVADDTDEGKTIDEETDEDDKKQQQEPAYSRTSIGHSIRHPRPLSFSFVPRPRIAAVTKPRKPGFPGRWQTPISIGRGVWPIHRSNSRGYCRAKCTEATEEEMPRGDLDFPLPTLGLSSYRACDLWPGGVPCQQGQLPKDNFQAFFQHFSGTMWNLTIYTSTNNEFLHISLPRLFAHWSNPSTQQSPSEIVEFARYLTQASQRRHTMSAAISEGPGLLLRHRRNRIGTPAPNIQRARQEPRARNQNLGQNEGADQVRLSSRYLFFFLTNVQEKVREIFRDPEEQFIIFECPQCPREFATSEAVDVHRGPVHGPGSSSLKPIQRVVLCYRHSVATRRPLSPESSLQKVYICGKCPSPARLGTYESWKDHYSRKHGCPKDLPPPVEIIDMDDFPIQALECVDCGMDSLHYHNLRQHHLRSHRNLSHDMRRHPMFVNRFKFVCLEAGCGCSFVRFTSLNYHTGKWHPGFAINYEYKRWSQLNDPSMAQPPASMVNEDSGSSEE